VMVQVETLTALLEQHSWPARFGVLLVDAEGFDLEVLRGLDFSRYRPDIILTEEYENNPQKQKLKFELLTQQGYRFCGIAGFDAVWENGRLDGAPAQEGRRTVSPGRGLLQELAVLPRKKGGLVVFDLPEGISGGRPIHDIPWCGDLNVMGWACKTVVDR